MLDRHNMPHRKLIATFWVLGATAAAALLSASALAQSGAANTISHDDTATCLACHSQPQGTKRAFDQKAFAASPHKDWKCQDCHTSITAAPHTPAMTKVKATCATCHSDQFEKYSTSAHSHADRQPGDHPTCVSCHAANSDPHAVHPAKQMTRKDKVALCSNCHKQKARMSRYGVDTDAVPSYMESFHGKSLVRFGMNKVAICSDCHRHHDVLAVNDPNAPTSRQNAAKTCAQTGCHPGAKVNFAMSGANHLRLKVKSSPVLLGILWFFRLLVYGTLAFMMTCVALDLRKKVFARGAGPATGKPAAVLISISFVCLVAALALSTLGTRGGSTATLLAFITMILALITYLVRPKAARQAHDPSEPMYERLSLTLRIQHIILATCFTLLAMTGLPQRFSQVPWAHYVLLVFGGLPTARIVHRTAAVVMVCGWIWHFAWLLLQWKRAGWSFKSWTMVPTLQDVKDFLTVSRGYLGGPDVNPRYGRFQFKEKMDYLAEYWGMPVMLISGAMLWMPIFWGNRLPEVALSAAIIAHGYEATLAFMAIVSWHMYNAHFNPDCFPGNPVWYTGMVSKTELEREHPLELQRLEDKQKPAPEGKADTNPDTGKTGA